MPLTPRVAVFPEGPGVGADPEQARACRQRAFWPQRSARQGWRKLGLGCLSSWGLLVPGVPVQSPCCRSQMNHSSAGDTAGVGIYGGHLLTAALLVLCSQARSPLGLWSLASALDTAGLRAALFRLREPGFLPPQPPSCLHCPGVPARLAHPCVCVPLVHSGCRPCWTPSAAPCSWKRCRRPEGQAWSRPGPREAVVRASLRTGPGLAGRVAGDVRRGPPPLPDAPVRSYGCREILFYVESIHASVLKVFGGFRDPAACYVLLSRLCCD